MKMKNLLVDKQSPLLSNVEVRNALGRQSGDKLRQMAIKLVD